MLMDEDERIMISLLEGMFINIAVKNESKYKACFPIVKMNSRINMDSFLKSQPRFVFYEELFMFNKSSSVLKLNIVNQIPDNILPIVKDKYKKHLGNCFNKKKSHKKRSLKRGKKRLRTFKRKRR